MLGVGNGSESVDGYGLTRDGIQMGLSLNDGMPNSCISVVRECRFMYEWYKDNKKKEEK